jgi:antitoxin component of MazEF toxin-antitoxin module
MEQIKTTVRKWGNSFGIILPKDIVNKENLQEGIEINLIINQENKITVGDIFELAKFNRLPKLKKSTEELMKEVDEELWQIKR